MIAGGLPGMVGVPGLVGGMMANPTRPNLPMGMNASQPANNKKQRELYVGNVPTGAVSESMMKELFAQMLNQCPGFKADLGAPVLNVQVRTGGAASGNGTGATFAFVEFRDEECAATIAAFNGMELYGRNLKISRPNGYVAPIEPVRPLDIPEEIMKRFGLGSYEAMRRQDRPPQELADRKARELYVGNLTIGCVNGAMLTELFTFPLQKLPLGQDGRGVATPVVEAKVDQCGKFAFVLFADDQLATMALAIFNKMELCGRPLCVDRPAGYTPDMSRPLPPGMLEQGMPTGGLGAPPEKSAAALAATNALKLAAASGGGGPALPLPVGGAAPAAIGGAGGGGVSAIGAPPAPLPDPPSKLLCLKNLLTSEALTDDKEFTECTEDIKEECSSFGTVTSFVAPRPSDLQGYSESDVGSCFVRFELLSSSVKAQLDLHGREFDGQRVSAVFVQEDGDGAPPHAIGSSAQGSADGGTNDVTVKPETM